MARIDTNANAEALAFAALAWTLSEPARAERLVALTGLAPDDLRRRIGEPSVLAATLAFLEANERDLVECAASLDTDPAALVRAREMLETAP